MSKKVKIPEKIYLDPDDDTVTYESLKDIEEATENFENGSTITVYEYEFVRKVTFERVSKLEEIKKK
jgi:hypothetical protein